MMLIQLSHLSSHLVARQPSYLRESPFRYPRGVDVTAIRQLDVTAIRQLDVTVTRGLVRDGKRHSGCPWRVGVSRQRERFRTLGQDVELGEFCGHNRHANTTYFVSRRCAPHRVRANTWRFGCTDEDNASFAHTHPAASHIR